MSRAVCPVLILVVLAVMAPRAVAVPLVSLSSPNNLAQLTVGQTVRSTSALGITDPNTGPNVDFIFRLYTEVLFPSSLFETPPPSTRADARANPPLAHPAGEFPRPLQPDRRERPGDFRRESRPGPRGASA